MYEANGITARIADGVTAEVQASLAAGLDVYRTAAGWFPGARRPDPGTHARALDVTMTMQAGSAAVPIRPPR